MNNTYVITLTTSIIVFVLAYSKIVHSNLLLKRELKKANITIEVLGDYINGLEGDSLEKDESVHKENFIKFLSESRDWAYKYIEDVQDGLGNFIKAVDKDIKHFDQYGLAGPTGPDQDSLKRISIAYKELIKLMPAEEN